ncbi:MAG: hypothetical protein IBJ18_00545 [Phycisphaerales bacterium]|nr:hypothetical protein [Phycisphaerales bacterium]
MVTCKTCGTQIKYPNGPGACVFTGGRIPSDIVDGSNDSIVSEKFRDGLIRLGVQGISFFPVKILNAPEKLVSAGIPNYYYIHCHYRVRRKNFPIDGEINRSCPECGIMIEHRKVDLRVGFEDPVPSNWQVFSVYPLTHSRIFCTFDIIQMARDLRLTNCGFHPIETLGVDADSWGGIDYEGKKWPPNWYPPLE